LQLGDSLGENTDFPNLLHESNRQPALWIPIIVAIDDLDFGRLNVGQTAPRVTEKIEFFGFVLPKPSTDL